MPHRPGRAGMHRRLGLALGALAALALLATSGLGPAAGPGPLAPPVADAGAATRARVLAAFGQAPLRFEPNAGQTDAAVQFLARGPGYTLFLTSDEAVLALRAPEIAGAPDAARDGDPRALPATGPAGPGRRQPAVASAPPAVLRLQLLMPPPRRSWRPRRRCPGG